MYEVRPASPSDLAAVIQLVVRLQTDPAHVIAFHGETAEEVAEELDGLRPDWASGAVVATDHNGRVRGVLSVEVDDEQRRAYLYGPFVDVPANHPGAERLWRATADALFARAAQLPRMAAVTSLDLFGHRRNRLLAEFAARHDVTVGRTMRLFTLTGTALRSLLVRPAGPVSGADQRVTLLPDDPAVRAAVARLHDRCFPTAPTPGAQLVAAGARHTVVVLLLGQRPIGYAAGYPQAEEYYVDVIGVDPEARSRGAGRSLVRRLLVELAAGAGARNRAAALVELGNDASERMFTTLGFTVETELVSYHRQATADAAR